MLAKVLAYVDTLKQIAEELKARSLPALRFADAELHLVISDIEAGKSVTEIVADLVRSGTTP